MYKHYFGLQDSPFSIAPNPQYLYMSTRHREALAHLLYGVKSDGGFILLTGEVGTGKTTVCRCLLAQIPSDVDIAMVLNPKQTALELLATICDEFNINYGADHSIKTLVDKLNLFLLDSHQAGRKAILIIDEAQNLAVDVLEQLRLLTNLETNQRKLLQIILLGQPELLTLLGRQELRQLSQRVTARFHLDALNRQEVAEYIQHRITVAGGNQSLFPPASVRRIYQISGGIPRLINLVCDRALLGAYVENQSRVSTAIVTKAAQEVLGQSDRRAFRLQTSTSIALLGTLLLILGGMFFMMQQNTNGIPSLSTLSTMTPQTIPPETMQLDPPADTEARLTAIPDTPKRNPAFNNKQSLSSLAGHNHYEPALLDVLGSWRGDMPVAVTEPICPSSATLGLSCFQAEMDLAEIAHMNRPVALNLGDGASARWVTLKQLNADHALFKVGNEEFWIARSELAAAGRFNGIALWRSPLGYQQVLKLGDSGTSVDTLVDTLSIIDTGKPTGELGFLFDLNLEQRIKTFQKNSGIDPDGMVGARTWIQLNSIAGADIPFLSAGVNN